MKMIDAITLAIADHQAINKNNEDFDFTDTLYDIHKLLELIQRAATEKKKGE